MRVLLTGASGFIGRHLAPVLRARGHFVVEARHASTPSGAEKSSTVPVDFAHDHNPAVWVPRVAGFDAVINAVGIFDQHGEQTFQALHVDAPVALFKACVLARVPRVIQISALGADAHALSRYHLSKRQADSELATLPLEWTIVQPSLVFGVDGTSAGFFAGLASLPCIPLPGTGDQEIQPIHIDDLTAGVAALLEGEAGYRRVIPFVGPARLSLRAYLTEIRSTLKFGRPRFFPVPMGLVRVAASLGRMLGSSLLSPESVGMLMRANTADPEPLRALLGREARPPSRFIAPDQVALLRAVDQQQWLLPLLRVSIALVWIVTGIVSFGLYPKESSFELLTRVGVPAALAPLFLYSASTLDLVFGLATLFMRRRRLLWRAQILLILGYTAIISIRMPEFWLHPYGPLLKNLPMLAGIYLLYRLEER